MQPVGIGVIGCGNISSAYLTAAKKFPILNLIALSDANPAAAEARAAYLQVLQQRPEVTGAPCLPAAR